MIATCPELAKMLGVTTQALHYHLIKPEAPPCEWRMHKRRKVRYYDKDAVMKFWQEIKG